jgi:hypothetical protein
MGKKVSSEAEGPQPALGPRGGKTTISPGGLMRKTFYLGPEEEELLREEAFRLRRSEGDIVRQLIRLHYGLDEPED